MRKTALLIALAAGLAGCGGPGGHGFTPAPALIVPLPDGSRGWAFQAASDPLGAAAGVTEEEVVAAYVETQELCPTDRFTVIDQRNAMPGDWNYVAVDALIRCED